MVAGTMKDELFSKREGLEEPVLLLPRDELPDAVGLH